MLFLQVFDVSQSGQDAEAPETAETVAADENDVRLARSAEKKVLWRIMPFIIMMCFVNYLDRTSVSFASLTMNKDLGLTAEQYGLGSGMFFLGYA
eukprot:jgi/Chrzof1/10511/Cz05g01150.t1